MCPLCCACTCSQHAEKSPFHAASPTFSTMVQLLSSSLPIGVKGNQSHACCFQGAVHEGDVRRECTASIALSMLLLLKQHLKSAYSMPPERIASFNPGRPRSLADAVQPALLNATRCGGVAQKACHTLLAERQPPAYLRPPVCCPELVMI